MTNQEIIADYPVLEAEDIRQSLVYASLVTRDLKMPVGLTFTLDSELG